MTSDPVRCAICGSDLTDEIRCRCRLVIGNPASRRGRPKSSGPSLTFDLCERCSIVARRALPAVLEEMIVKAVNRVMGGAAKEQSGVETETETDGEDEHGVEETW